MQSLKPEPEHVWELKSKASIIQKRTNNPQGLTNIIINEIGLTGLVFKYLSK